MGDFVKAFDALIGNEGRLSTIAADPGNWTGGKVASGALLGSIWGLSASVLARHGVKSAAAIASTTQAQAMVIAKLEYWDVVRGDELPDPLAFQVLDAAYNSGPANAIEWLRDAVGLSATGPLEDSVMDDIRCAVLPNVILRFNASRLTFLASLTTWPTFGRGWARRVADNMLRATV